MIVDDSIIVRKNLNSILSAAGHNVVAEADNGELAVQLFDKHKPDLTTMDITMPRMNGIDAVRKIMNKYETAKIIVISGIDQKNLILEALELGIINYILKPVSANNLIEKINKALE